MADNNKQTIHASATLQLLATEAAEAATELDINKLVKRRADAKASFEEQKRGCEKGEGCYKAEDKNHERLRK